MEIIVSRGCRTGWRLHGPLSNSRMAIHRSPAKEQSNDRMPRSRESHLPRLLSLRSPMTGGTVRKSRKLLHRERTRSSRFLQVHCSPPPMCARRLAASIWKLELWHGQPLSRFTRTSLKGILADIPAYNESRHCCLRFKADSFPWLKRWRLNHFWKQRNRYFRCIGVPRYFRISLWNV